MNQTAPSFEQQMKSTGIQTETEKNTSYGVTPVQLRSSLLTAVDNYFGLYAM